MSDDLLRRLDAASLPLITTGFGSYPDMTSIAGTMREAAARIRELEAQVAEARAEGFRQGIEAAAHECEAHAHWIEREGRQGLYPAEGVLRTSARNIRAALKGDSNGRPDP